MNERTRWLLLMVLVIVLVLPALTLAANGYTLSWWTVDGGGGTFSTGGAYALGGTSGQPDAGATSGGSYTLVGGFWGGGISGAMSRYVYLPIVLR